MYLSHQGILAIYPDGNTVQFTNLNTNRQVEMEVESYSLAGFYDNVILLITYQKPLRETMIESVFENPNIETFKAIEGTNNVLQNTDVSLLNDKRVLYYPTTDCDMFSFNVDTRVITQINVGRKIWIMASFAGINCGVEAVFWGYDDDCTYALDKDNTITKINERQDYGSTTIFSSTSDPQNIINAVFKHGNYLMKGGNMIHTDKLIEFDNYYSIIRVYRDIFLVYDNDIMSWVLLRIITP